jgi:hypothetical protein
VLTTVASVNGNIDFIFIALVELLF